MKKLYEKSELAFAIVWIVIYCVLQSVANPINELIGIDYLASAVFGVAQTIVLLIFIVKNKLCKQYGLCKSPVATRSFLFYVPLAVLASGNLWNGVALNYPIAEIACRVYRAGTAFGGTKRNCAVRRFGSGAGYVYVQANRVHGKKQSVRSRPPVNAKGQTPTHSSRGVANPR